MKIGIIAAMPGELEPLVKKWKRIPNMAKDVSMWRRPGGTDEVLAVCAGMGANAARRAFAAVEAEGKLDLVLSVGWAGALTESDDVGLVMSEVIDAQTGERYSLTEGKRKLRVVTTVRVADAADKQRLAKTYGAAVVDMEAAVVARLARMREIPMCCFKAVSDGLNARLPDINPYIDAGGQLRMMPFLGHVAVRPRYWGSLLEMGRRSEQGARDLAELIEKFLVTKDVETVNRTGQVG